jgi:putative hydrolase of the HAD superfamily
MEKLHDYEVHEIQGVPGAGDRASRAILFDDGGVLLRLDWHEVDAYGRRYGLPWGAFARTLYQSAAWRGYQAGRIGREEWLADARLQLGRYWGGCAEERLTAWLAQSCEPNDDCLELARACKAAGHRVAVVSNAEGAAVDVLRGGLGPPLGWDAIVTAAEVGVAKPDPEISRIAAARLGVEVEHCFVVDDVAENVAAARLVGMQAHRFDGSQVLLRDRLRRAGFAWEGAAAVA